MKKETIYIEPKRNKDVQLVKKFKEKCKKIEEPYARIVFQLIKKWLEENVKSE